VTTERELDELLRISHAVGGDPDWVQGGGGNTSVKSTRGEQAGSSVSIDRAASMWVKTSGFALAEMDATRGWAELDLRATLAILDDPTLAREPARRREERVLELLRAAARRPSNVRPSVESSLHALLDRVVVHSHPVHLTSFLCARDSREKWRDVLGSAGDWTGKHATVDSAVLYVPYVDPGYTLAAKLRDEIAEHTRRFGARPRVVLLENHGLFVAADSVDECLALHERVAAAGRRWAGNRRVNPLHFDFVRVEPSSGDAEHPICANDVAAFASAGPSAQPRASTASRREWTAARIRGALLRGGAQPVVVRRDDSPTVHAIARDAASLRTLASGAFTPDQIVYCKTRPVVVRLDEGERDDGARREDADERSATAVREYRERHGLDPRVVLLESLRAPSLPPLFHVAPDLAQLRVVAETHRLAMTALLASGRAGGPRLLDERQARFIEEWEVERFRAALLRGGEKDARSNGLEGRVVLLLDGESGARDDALAADRRALLAAGATLFECAASGTPAPRHRLLPIAFDPSDELAASRAADAIHDSVGALDAIVVAGARERCEPTLAACAELMRRSSAGEPIVLAADGRATDALLAALVSASRS
jgi:rhamnose utilization protein RhaD (predicted bifunctional aldolase and dehydrogenase)